MEENEHIDKHIKSSLQAYVVLPRITSFDDILLKMKKKRRRRFLIFFFPGLFFLIGGMFLIINNTGLTEEIKKQKQVAVVATEKKSESPAVANSVASHPAPAKGSAPVQNISPPQDQVPSSNSKKPIGTKKDPVILSGHATGKSPGTENAKILSEEKNPTQEQPSPQNQGQIAGVQNVTEPLISDSLKTDFLEPQLAVLPLTETQPEILLNPVKESEADPTPKDSAKKQKPWQFFMGAAFNPQLGSYYFQENRNTWYDQTSRDMYLTSKRGQNKISFNYAFGLKAGMIVRDKWEIMLGFGFQKYIQQEKINPLVIAPSSLANPTPNNPGFVYNASFGDYPAEPGRTYTNEFRYWDYSLELSRFFTIKKGLKTKLGLGIHSQRRTVFLSDGSNIVVVGEDSKLYLQDSYVNDWQINRNLATLNLKAGLIEDLTKTIQVQFCPNLQYSLNSMYAKNYLIKQKSITIGMECLLLFKIR